MSTFNTKVHNEQGGDTLTVESGGAVSIESGGSFTAASGSTVTLAGTVDASSAALTLPNGNITGAKVATVANVNVVGGVPVVHRVTVPGGANANVDVTLTYKTRVIDAWAVMAGAGTAGCTLVVGNAGNAITDTMDVSALGDRDVARCGEINDANHEIAAAGTLRVTKASTGGDFPGAEVYVLGLRVA